jgi:hypothetical protein
MTGEMTSAIAFVDACAPRKQKRNQNTLDESDFVRDVDNRDYHQQSHCEIAGGKRIYRHLSGSSQTSLHNLQELLQFRVLCLGFFQDGNVGVGVC